MKTAATRLLLILFIFGIFYGCEKQVVEPKFTGTIKGQVQSSKTGKGIPQVSVSTNPGTSAILTDNNGHFVFKNIPTGDYAIQAIKDGYKATVVNVHVSKNKTVTAQILMKKKMTSRPVNLLKPR